MHINDRRLNDAMSVAKLFSYAPVVNVHFHSNSGNPSRESYDDDEHLFATPDNLEHFSRYIKSFRRYGMPVVLEIDRLEQHTDDELAAYVAGLRGAISGASA